MATEVVCVITEAANCTRAVKLIGASLSEPHIDGDVRPTSRGMFVYMYVSGRVVRLSASNVPENTPIQSITTPSARDQWTTPSR